MALSFNGVCYGDQAAAVVALNEYFPLVDGGVVWQVFTPFAASGAFGAVGGLQYKTLTSGDTWSATLTRTFEFGQCTLADYDEAAGAELFFLAFSFVLMLWILADQIRLVFQAVKDS